MVGTAPPIRRAPHLPLPSMHLDYQPAGKRRRKGLQTTLDEQPRQHPNTGTSRQLLSSVPSICLQTVQHSTIHILHRKFPTYTQPQTPQETNTPPATTITIIHITPEHTDRQHGQPDHSSSPTHNTQRNPTHLPQPCLLYTSPSPRD